MDSDKKTIVVSAINFTEGGPLTVLKECLGYLDTLVEDSKEYKVIAIVYDKKLFQYNKINYIEIKSAKQSWLKRIYIEYIYFFQLSKKIKPYLWLSLHDISPRVRAIHRVVYCHNPSPFYKLRLKDLYFNYRVFLFSMFYKFLYKINIKKNSYVVVQQNWLREKFMQLYNIEKHKIVVAYPNTQINLSKNSLSFSVKDADQLIFFYPSFPRPFKNFEVICEAVKILLDQGISEFKVVLTINGSENNYSKWLINKYKNIKNLEFTGILPYEKVLDYYSKSDCLIFPSKLETWGLPISEFASYNKPMLLADLPYAHETASGAKLVQFFNPYKSEELARIMKDLIINDMSGFTLCNKIDILQPFVQDWGDLFKIILK